MSDPTIPAEAVKTIKEIVFGTRVARSVEVEDPATIVHITADRIWYNIACYFATGDWPDRRRSAEEIDAEDLADALVAEALLADARERLARPKTRKRKAALQPKAGS